VSDERAHLAGRGHLGQGVDRATAAGEHVDRSAADRLDHPLQVARVIVGRDLAIAVGARAPCGAPGVVGDDRAIGEVGRPSGTNPAASIGEPMSSSGVPSPRVPRTSYVMVAPAASRVWVAIAVVIGVS
jgi:hypothetical protein